MCTVVATDYSRIGQTSKNWCKLGQKLKPMSQKAQTPFKWDYVKC